MRRVQSRRKRAEPQAQVVDLRADRALGSVVGFVSSYRRGEVSVDFPGNERGPLAARVSTALDGAALEAAAATQQDALLIFEGGDPARPILMSLLRSVTPMVDLLLGQPHQPAPDHVRVDGERVSIEGKEEVVLRCGKASLTLRRDGKVLLRGVNVVSQADQVHKVRGGKVQIN
jgi:hypothetical protein